jgi:putative oxidoreductase
VKHCLLLRNQLADIPEHHGVDMKPLFVIGRAIFGAYFLYSGINHFKQHQMLTGYAASKSVPAPEHAVTATGIALLIGGTSLTLGLKPGIGALAIAAFLAGVSPMMHDFWRIEDPNQRSSDMINFTKNMALLGAALMLIGLEER